MSLVKRLWIAVGLIASAAFLVAVGINMVSAKRYLENEIKIKNLDTATALAMTVSQTATDATTVELLLSSQFDLGHYQRIEYLAPDGHLVASRERSLRPSTVPAWFGSLVPITPEPAEAIIQSGWKQLGSIRLQSDPSFAYDSLWQSARTLMQLYVGGVVVIGLLGMLFIRSIIKPLMRVVDQAEALAERRFIEVKPPRTLEFRLIVQAMNRLTQKIKNLLDDESARLHKLKSDYEYDPLTGFMVRDAFSRNAATEIEREDTHEQGLLVLVHIGNLEELNREIGRVQTDHLIQQLALQLKPALAEHGRVLPGRLSSADLGFLVPGHTDSTRLVRQCLEHIQQVEDGHMLQLRFGVAHYGPHSTLSDILLRCDQSLAPISGEGQLPTMPVSSMPSSRSASDWNDILDAALRKHEFQLALFPVRGREGEQLHTQALARIHSSVCGEILVAGAFLPWARRQGQVGLLDLEVIAQALKTVQQSGQDVCINLGFESVCDARQVQRIAELCQQHPGDAPHLCFDIPEEIVFQHETEFQRFCARMLPMGCKIGVKHLDAHLGHLGRLSSLGLRYLKVSRSLVLNIDREASAQIMLRGLCTIAHTLGMQVIAEGVTDHADAELLFKLGFDGVSDRVIA